MMMCEGDGEGKGREGKDKASHHERCSTVEVVWIVASDCHSCWCVWKGKRRVRKNWKDRKEAKRREAER